MMHLVYGKGIYSHETFRVKQSLRARGTALLRPRQGGRSPSVEGETADTHSHGHRKRFPAYFSMTMFIYLQAAAQEWVFAASLTHLKHFHVHSLHPSLLLA